MSELYFLRNLFNLFLDSKNKESSKVRDRLGSRGKEWRNNRFDWNRRRERNIPATTKSGRIIKGRGVFVSVLKNFMEEILIRLFFLALSYAFS